VSTNVKLRNIRNRAHSFFIQFNNAASHDLYWVRKKLERRLELDAARGLMLLWITLTHLPTVASVYVNQPFGFFSAAEGFIFLSALFTGRIYFRVATRDGVGTMRKKLGLRTLRLYSYHALLMLATFLVAVPIATRSNRPGLHNLLDYYFAVGPVHAGVNAALLVYRPPLLDILPMYIIFLLLTCAVMSIALRVGWKMVLGGSFALWLLAQFGLRQDAYGWLTHAGVAIPLNQMGSFDLWAWQFLWMLGLWFGVRWAKNDLRLGDWSRRLAAPAVLVVIALLGLRYLVGNGIELGRWEVNFDKWHLGGVRLLDFSAFAILLIRAQSFVKTLAVRPLVMLGQSSLQVFCAHLFFCFFGLTIMGSASMVSGWRQVLLLGLTFSALFFTAKIFAKPEKIPAQAKNATTVASGPRVLASQ